MKLGTIRKERNRGRMRTLVTTFTEQNNLMTIRKSYASTLLVLALLIGLAVPGWAKDKPKYEIKFASLAPEGSTWQNYMRELDKEVREATNGEVGFKIYPGGVQGDEPDVLRKIRFGQLHAAGFTGNGLGEVLPSIRLLELPFFYNDISELDYITQKFTPYYDEAFREKGFVLLGWAEVGNIYFFSTKPVGNLRELKELNVWVWQGDPLPTALFDALNISPVPLSVPEVLTGLQTGMIEAVYSSPVATISLQWFTRVNYMNTSPLTVSMGAVLMSKNMFDKMPPEYQEIVLTKSREKMRALTLQSRVENDQGIEEMARAGIKMVEPPSSEEMASYEKELGETLRQRLTGQLYSKELLDSVKTELQKYRENGGE